MAFLMAYLNNLLIAFSQLINAISGGNPNEMLSARAYREDIKWLIAALDFIFRDNQHCYKAFKDELLRTQLPEYVGLTLDEDE